MQRRQDPSGYTVRLASIYSVRMHDLSRYFDAFRAAVPGADVDLEYMHPDQIYTRIQNDQSDLGLISFANPGRDLTAVPWQSQAMVVSCLPAHPFGRRTGAVGPWELSGESFVTFDRRLPVRREIDRFLRRHDAEVDVVAEFDNIENIKQALEDGAGVAILPEPTVRSEVHRKALVAVPLDTLDGEAPFVRPLSIIHRRKRRLNPAVTEFINRLLSRETGENGGPRARKAAARAEDVGPRGARGTERGYRVAMSTMNMAGPTPRGVPGAQPRAEGLYDPRFEHDSCGVGFVVNIKGERSHKLVRQAFEVVVNLRHRGACGCEANTGDGAGPAPPATP